MLYPYSYGALCTPGFCRPFRETAILFGCLKNNSKYLGALCIGYKSYEIFSNQHGNIMTFDSWKRKQNHYKFSSNLAWNFNDQCILSWTCLKGQSFESGCTPDILKG